MISTVAGLRAKVKSDGGNRLRSKKAGKDRKGGERCKKFFVFWKRIDEQRISIQITSFLYVSPLGFKL